MTRRRIAAPPLALLLMACGGSGAGGSTDSGAADGLQDAAPASFDRGRSADASTEAHVTDVSVADAATPPDARPSPPAPDAKPRFRFGIDAAQRGKMQSTPVYHVDDDPVDHPEAPTTCTNFEGGHFPFCYDGHTGSDFLLRGGFPTMDNGSATVVAAAGGVVEVAEDGNYDRCHASAASVDVVCDGHEMRANYVQLRHANGWVSLYYHLKSGSVLVHVGDRVTCGQPLGLVGSSGRSSMPHLHFQVEDSAGAVVDPFGGAFSQPESLFTEQKAADGLPGGSCDPAWTLPPE